MRARGAVAFGTALIACLCLGLWLGGHPQHLPGFARDLFAPEPVAVTAEAAEAIEDIYFRPVDGKRLGDASVQGMVRSLRRRNDDRFSEYISPAHLAAFSEQIEGRFSGIGVSAVPVRGGLRVVRTFPRSPAAGAGIGPGDTIVSVDGVSIAGMPSAKSTARIKGPEGTEVTIGVRDGESGEVRRVRLRRAEVTVPNVSSQLRRVDGRKLGYLRLASFSRTAHGQLGEALRRLLRRNAEGIVLDLRGNPGGLLREAVLAAGLFLPEGSVVVRTVSRSEGETVHETGGSDLPRRPLAVLIDGGTASAAEILTAALADDAGALVVGTRSYGKGLYQQEVGLGNGGALKLTVGEYFTPKGKNLAETNGIRPQIRVADRPGTVPDEAKRTALEALAARLSR